MLTPTAPTATDRVTTLLTTFGLTIAAQELVPRLSQAGQLEVVPVLVEVFDAEAEARRQRLRVAGWSDEEISRIHGPIGIEIGAVTPGEVAVAILAEITSARYRRGEPLALTGEIRRLDKSAG